MDKYNVKDKQLSKIYMKIRGSKITSIFRVINFMSLEKIA